MRSRLRERVQSQPGRGRGGFVSVLRRWEWDGELDLAVKEDMTFTDALDLLDRAANLDKVCILHRRRLAAKLSLRVPRNGDTLNEILTQVSGAAANPWGLKTSPETYPLFQPSHRPARPKDILGSMRFLANKSEEYHPPVDPLWKDLRRQFTGRVVEVWKRQGTATLRGLFSWWGTEAVEGFPEATIAEVMEGEFSMYSHHLNRPDKGPQSPLPNMLHSLVQQVAMQDPAYYRVLVAFRTDHAWRLVSFPCFSQCPLPDWEDSRNIIQGAIAVADDEAGNWKKGDANMASHGHSNELKQTWQGILPCLIAVEEEGETLEQPGLQTAPGLATAHRLLTLPPQYPEELQWEYRNAPLRFPLAVELGYLGALSDALLGRRGRDSPEVRAEMSIVLGERLQAEQFFREWRRRAVEQVLRAFQDEKAAERKRYQANSYFSWVESNPDKPFPPDNDPSPPWSEQKYARYCG